MREWLKHFCLLLHKCFESFGWNQWLFGPRCGPDFSSRSQPSLDLGGAEQPETDGEDDGKDGTEDGKVVAAVARVHVVAALDAAAHVSERKDEEKRTLEQEG